MANDLELKIRIGAELKELREALRQVQTDVKGLGDNLKKNTGGAEQAFNGIEKAARSAAAAVAGFFTVGAAVNLTKAIIQTADAYQQLQGRLKLVTDSTEELAAAQAGIMAIAQTTGGELAATTDLYTRLARSTESLGLSQGELLRVTETVNKAVALSGSTAESASAALFQLGQGLASGTLRGEELNSVMEQTPRLAQALADGLGVTIGELRQLGQEGKLTSDTIVAALGVAAQEVDAEFSALPDSVGRAMQRLKNEVVTAVGQADLSPLIDAVNDLRTTISDPAIIQNLTSIASAIVSVTGAAINGASAVADFTRWVGEEMAAQVGGPALDDVVRLSERIDELRERIGAIQGAGTISEFLNAPFLREYQAELARLEPLLADAQRAQEQAAVASQRRAQQQREETKALEEKAKADLEASRAAGEAKLAEEEAAKEAELRAKQVAGMVENLEKQAATYGKSAADVAEYELRLLGASTAEIERARSLAQQVEALKAQEEAQKDAARAAKEAQREAEELAKKEAELSRAKEEVRARLLTAQGNVAEGRFLQLSLQYDELIADLEAKGDAAGVELVRSLINLEVADAQLQQLQDKVSTALDELRAREESAGNRVLTGDIGQAQGAQDVQNARGEALANLQTYRAELQAMVAQDIPGAADALRQVDGEIARISDQSLTGMGAAIRDLRAELVQLQETVAGDVVNALRDNLTGLFEDLATGAKSGKEALADFARGFIRSMVSIAAQALSTYLVLQLLDAVFPGAGKLVAASGNIGAGVKHTGGIAGRGGARRQVDPALFLAAPRYHSGGVAGLKPGEVPAILQAGEEVLTRDDPRHVANGGGAQQSSGTRIINVIDPNMVQDYMTSSSGEEVLLNVLQRNSGMIKQVLS